MTSEVVDFSGFEDTSNTFKEAEAQDAKAGAEADLETSPVPPHSEEELVLHLGQNKNTAFWYSFVDWAASGDTLVGLYVQFNLLPPDEVQIEFVKIADEDITSGSQIRLVVKRVDASNHELVVLEADGTEAASYANPFVVDTWARVEFRWQHENSSPLDVWIDGSSVISTSAKDFYSEDDTLRLLFFGQGGDPLENPTGTSINSYYIKTGGNQGTADFIGDFVVKKYQIKKTGATPDDGVNLDAGAWTDTSDGSSSAEARYNSFHEGYCILDDSPTAGIVGSVSPNAILLAGKWTWYCTGTVTSGDLHVTYGFSTGSAEITTTDSTTITRSSKPWNVVQDANLQANLRVPNVSEWFVLGFKNDSGEGGSPVYLLEAWCFGLFKAPVPLIGPTTVHLRGGHVRGGHIAGK